MTLIEKKICRRAAPEPTISFWLLFPDLGNFSFFTAVCNFNLSSGYQYLGHRRRTHRGSIGISPDFNMACQWFFIVNYLRIVLRLWACLNHINIYFCKYDTFLSVLCVFFPIRVPVAVLQKQYSQVSKTLVSIITQCASSKDTVAPLKSVSEDLQNSFYVWESSFICLVL